MDKAAPRRRLIAKLGFFLIRNAQTVSVVFYFAGFITVLLLPLLAKNTYISENALLPGSASPRYSDQNTKEANDFINELLTLKSGHHHNLLKIQNLLFKRMSDSGGDVYFHSFLAPDRTHKPSSFFLDSQQQQSNDFRMYSMNSSHSAGMNVVGIVRAPRSDGKEAIVLVTPFRSDDLSLNDALALGAGYSLFHLFSRTIWLAKDIVWLAADSKYGAHAAVASWLRDYYQPVFHVSSSFKSEAKFHGPDFKGFCYEYSNCNNHFKFQRAGTIAAALVIQVQDRYPKVDKDTVNIFAEATNGQMPNLDLINVVNFLAVHRQGIQTKVGSFSSLLKWKSLFALGQMFELLGKLASILNPDWKFGLPTMEYVQGAAVLASSIYCQAMGLPSGPHGAFRDYQIDAITIEFSSRSSLDIERVRRAFLLKLGRLTEGAVRSINNLLEKFHQSFFLYFLTASGRFISVGIYMIPFALLVTPLVIVAAALCSYKDIDIFPYVKPNKNVTTLDHDTPEVAQGGELQEMTEDIGSSKKIGHVELGLSPSSWKWFNAAKLAVFVHLWAILVSMLPAYIHMFSLTPEMKLFVWSIISALTLVIGCQLLGFSHFVFSKPDDADEETYMEGWVALKAVTLGATAIGLGIMSVINYATALLGALVLVPMCLSSYPLKHIFKLGVFRKYVLLSLLVSFIVLAFPPSTFLIARVVFDEFSEASLVDFWKWTELLWSWGSATYPYLFLVHIPCWVLCLVVILYA